MALIDALPSFAAKDCFSCSRKIVLDFSRFGKISWYDMVLSNILPSQIATQKYLFF